MLRKISCISHVATTLCATLLVSTPAIAAKPLDYDNFAFFQPEPRSLGAEEVEAILKPIYEQQTRPTPEDLEQLIPEEIRKNPSFIEQVEKIWKSELPNFAVNRAPSIALDKKTIVEHIAWQIARLELAFPNGTYAFVGRDSAPIADWLDAYYRSKGAFGRVVRVELSGTMMQKMKTEDLKALLHSIGYRPETAQPFVFVDSTRYQRNSQSGWWMAEVLSQELKHKQSNDDIVRHTNIVDLNGNVQGTEIQTKDDVERIFAQQALSLTANKQDHLGVPLGMQVQTPFIYSLEWHESFQHFVRVQNRLVAQPPQVNQLEMRRVILASTLHAMEIAASPDFDEAVQRLARTLGTTVVVQKETRTSPLKSQTKQRFLALGKTRDLARQRAQNRKNPIRAQIELRFGPDSIGRYVWFRNRDQKYPQSMVVTERQQILHDLNAPNELILEQLIRTLPPKAADANDYAISGVVVLLSQPQSRSFWRLLENLSVSHKSKLQGYFNFEKTLSNMRSNNTLDNNLPYEKTLMRNIERFKAIVDGEPQVKQCKSVL